MAERNPKWIYVTNDMLKYWEALRYISNDLVSLRLVINR